MREPLTSKRWRMVKHIFQAAIELAPEKRAAYLARACAADPSLLSEVESLLASHEKPGNFMDTPAFDLAAPSLSSNRDIEMVGESLGRYSILTLLGRGGMGRVYKAKDLTLGREVAIKVLTPDVSADRFRLRRFEHEARAASALNHPNIITIHEFGQEGGIHFIVSEFIEGETLRRRMAGEQMSLDAFVDIAIQITGALNAAHEAGIVHRDIKPENIMVRPDGLVKVLDFGLAKLIEERPVESAAADGEATMAGWEWTETGRVMGTVNYMSPEQVRGQRLDRRTDIFSLGVVLYEMIAGRSPFERGTASDVMVSILEKEPQPLTQLATGTPEALEAIINKALSKDREQRYQTAGELLADLRRLKNGEAIDAPLLKKIEPGSKRPVDGRGAASARSKILLAASAAALLLASLAVALLLRQSPEKEATGGKAVRSIAVLPFKPMTEEGDELLELGMADALITRLAGVRKIIVRPTSSVLKFHRLRQDVVSTGRELKVDALLDGHIQRSGERVRVTVQLISVTGGAPLWADKFEAEYTDIFTVQDAISEQIARALALTLTGEEHQQLTRRYTESQEAYEAYMKGRFWWNKRSPDGFSKAIDYFNQAITIDPNYALAHAGLAECYAIMSSFNRMSPEASYTKARAAAARALELDDRLAQAHTALAHIAWLYRWNWAEAERRFRQALDLDPNYPTARQWYGAYLSAMGRHEEALAQAKIGREIDPLSVAAQKNLARAYFFARQYEMAIEASMRTLELDLNHYTVNSWLEFSHEMLGRYDEAVASRQRAMALIGVDAEEIAALQTAYAESGWRGYWQQEAALAEERGRGMDYNRARTYARLGDRDRAFLYLEKAYAKRSDHLVLLKTDPILDSLRDDPRFRHLMRRVGLPQ